MRTDSGAHDETRANALAVGCGACGEHAVIPQTAISTASENFDIQETPKCLGFNVQTVETPQEGVRGRKIPEASKLSTQTV
jgi:hypothetical protein